MAKTHSDRDFDNVDVSVKIEGFLNFWLFGVTAPTLTRVMALQGVDTSVTMAALQQLASVDKLCARPSYLARFGRGDVFQLTRNLPSKEFFPPYRQVKPAEIKL